MLRLFVLLALFCIPTPGRAGSFTPESAVAHALQHNPDLIAARHSIAEAEGRLRQAGRLANPEIAAELKPNVQGREFSVGVEYMQRFPLTNRLRFEQAVSQAQVSVAEAEVRIAERRLVQDVRTLVVKMQGLKARRALAEEQSATSGELAVVASKAAATGEGSALEAAQLELEAQQLSLEALRLDAAHDVLVAGLRPLLGVAPNDPIEITGALVDPHPIAGPGAEISHRPEMQAARARVEVARQNLALEQKNRWQDAAVGVAAELDRAEDAPDGLQTDGFIGLKFSLPLPLWNKNEGRIMEAEATAHRRGAEAAALAASLRAEAATARAEMVAAAAAYRQTSTNLLPKARQLEDRFFAAYQSGQAPLTDVLRTREKRLALEAAGLDARRDFNLARVRYEAAVGR